MKTTFASPLRRPLSQKERIAWIILFLIVVVGVRYFAPHFRPATPVEAPIMPGLRIEDAVVSGLPQSVLHAETTLSFDPAEVQTNIGKAFTLKAAVDTTTNHVSGAELYVHFDPTKLKLVSIAASPVFSLSLQSPVIDNRQGTGSIAIGVPLEQSAVVGRQVIATFNFRALALASNTEVTFSERTIVAADDEPGSVVRERRAARVSIR
jgi:hypothetical protein